MEKNWNTNNFIKNSEDYWEWGTSKESQKVHWPKHSKQNNKDEDARKLQFARFYQSAPIIEHDYFNSESFLYLSYKRRKTGCNIYFNKSSTFFHKYINYSFLLVKSVQAKFLILLLQLKLHTHLSMGANIRDHIYRKFKEISPIRGQISKLEKIFFSKSITEEKKG